MEYLAISRNVKISPRKLRLIADSVRNVGISVAISQLMGSNKRASLPLAKTIQSAVANAVNNFKSDKNNLAIKELVIQEGAVYKRYHYAARGRARPYERKTSHIRVILVDKEIKVQAEEKKKGGEEKSKVKSQNSKVQVKNKK